MKLYKYRAINSFAEDIIRNSCLYYPIPKTLNDPCEIIHPIKFTKSISDSVLLEAHLRLQQGTSVRLIDKGGEIFRREAFDFFKDPLRRYWKVGDPLPMPSPKPQYDGIEELYEELEIHEALKLYVLCVMEDVVLQDETEAAAINKIQSKLNASGLLCFSSVNNDQLMFAHYASNHTGIVLEFETSKDSDFAKAQNVQYCQQRPKITADNISDLLYIKSAAWSYECEYRLVRKVGDKAYAFAPEALTGIIFGCRTSDSEKAQVRRWVIESGRNIRFYQAESDPSTFSLLISAI